MAKLVYDKDGRLLFTKEMKKEYTILFPMMAKIHFHLMKNIFAKFGYKVALLETGIICINLCYKTTIYRLLFYL